MIRHEPEFSAFDTSTLRLRFLTADFAHYSYEDLLSFTGWLSSNIPAAEPGPEQPLLIISDNSKEVILLIAACFILKIPVLPVNENIPAGEMTKVLRAIKPRAYYSGNPVELDELASVPKLRLPQGPTQLQLSVDSADITFDEPEKIAGYFLTSGSTGTPKVVPVKRRQVFYGAASSAKNFQPSPNKYWLLCLPVHHVGGINVIYRSLLYQSAVHLVSVFDTEEIKGLLHENKQFEAASLVPTMLRKLLDHTFFRVQFQFKAILLGGGPISMSLINESLTRGLPIVTSYGMTETCAQIAANPMLQPSGAYTPKKSVGTLFEPNEIQIRDKNRNPLPANESGQIWLKGPQVFDGYLEESKNRRVFDKNGWFNTGDFGHMNRKKQLFIETRRSDLIITGGENVNPAEVEEAINNLEGVSESAVLGVPDEKWGQTVVAFVVLNDSAIERNQIKKELKDKLQGYKVPKQIISLKELPKTTSQKVNKPELLKWYISRYL